MKIFKKIINLIFHSLGIGIITTLITLKGGIDNSKLLYYLDIVLACTFTLSLLFMVWEHIVDFTRDRKIKRIIYKQKLEKIVIKKNIERKETKIEMEKENGITSTRPDITR